MKIGVMSDLHLGHRQYGSMDREYDFYIQLQRCVDELNKHDCDIVIIAGDIFDKPNPSPEAIYKYQDNLGNLNCDVILATKGNHTMLLRDNHYPIDNFFADTDWEGYYLLEDESWTTGMHAMATQHDLEYTKYQKSNEIWVDGITYRGNSQLDEFIQVQHDLAAAKSLKGGYRILVIHQAVAEFCGFTGAELSINDFDLKPYDLVICGHIHSRLCTTLENGTVFLQPGSIERLNTTEANDEINNGKGVWVVDTDTQDIQFYKVESNRQFLMGRVDIRTEEDIEAHKESVLKKQELLDTPPIISYEYHDYLGNRTKISDMNIDISKESLMNNSNIYDESQEEIIYDIEEDGQPTVSQMIKQNDNFTEKEQQLAIDIFESSKKELDIESLLENFRKKNFNDGIDAKDMQRYEDEKKNIEELEAFFDNL